MSSVANEDNKSSNTQRYFSAKKVEGNLVKIKKKSKKHQKFEGKVIKVETGKPKPLNKKLKNVPPKRELRKKMPKELLDKYTRGEKVEAEGVKTNFYREKQKRKEIYLEYATEQAARTELLLQENYGFIEPGEEEITAKYNQKDIVDNVDIQSASKHFKLNLDFGPYRMRYTKHGRSLLLGGGRGHVAAFDWVTKKLHCEINVMEEVADISWTHVNTMFACAQKNWVYFYDNQGIELHCVKRLYRVNRMEFLPYHFLLATANHDGYVSWLDISIGELVGNYNTRQGDIRLMCINPANGVLCTGGGKGVVSMWSPKVREPLAKLLCHSASMSALTIDPKGLHMVTAGLENLVKVWDVRALKGPLVSYKLRLPANQVEVSQRGLLAIAQGNYCEMYSSLLVGKAAKTPYLRQHCNGFIHGMRFCPYEDVLGISTSNGFESLLVPGAGEPNYDALEDNPFQTKKQRREHEVHALLEKIPPELITLDPNEVAGVDIPTLQEKIEAKRSVFFIKPPQIDFKTRRKMKGKGGSANAAKSKQIVKDQKRKEFIQDIRKAKNQVINESKVQKETYIPLEKEAKSSVLDRFKPKKKKV